MPSSYKPHWRSGEPARPTFVVALIIVIAACTAAAGVAILEAISRAL